MITRTRSRVLGLAASVIPFAMLLTACSGNTTADVPSDTEVIVGTWGGDYEKFQGAFIKPIFQDAFDADVIYATGEVATRMTKARTEANGTGSFDIIGLNDTDMQQMADEGLLEELDLSKLPNGNNVLEDLQSPYWIPHIYSGLVLLYNSDEVAAPTSWDALWDPKYEGKIGIETSGTETNWLFAAASAELGGDPKQNWDAGWPRLEELAKSAQMFGSSEEIAQALASGQIWMTIDYKSRAYQWASDSKAPLKSVIPEEGSMPRVFAAGMPKNAPHKEAAYEYLNAMIDPSAQEEFAVNMGYIPTVTNAPLPAELLTQIGFTDEEQSMVHSVDTAYVVEHAAEWRQKWQQEILNK